MRTSKKLQEIIRGWHNGVGVLCYKSSSTTIIEVDVCINRKTRQLCHCSTGKPVEFNVDFDEEGSDEVS